MKNTLRFSILGVCMLVLTFVIGLQLDVYENGFSDSDEAAHFVNSYFIWNYLTTGDFANPIKYAQEFYTAYPKLSLGHWPPLYYVLVGAAFLILPAMATSVAIINSVVVALVAASAGMLLMNNIRRWAALVFGVLYILSPLSVKSIQFFMLDQPLTLTVLLAAWIWQRYVDTGKLYWAALYGLMAAAAILIKGNGWLLGLFPLLHITFFRYGHVFRNWRTYFGAVLCLIFVVPWYMITAKISADGFNYSFGVPYMLTSLRENSLIVISELGYLGSVLALLGVIANWSHKELSRASLVRLSLSILTAVLIFQAIVPVDISDRYLMPAMPFCWALVLLGIISLGELAFFQEQRFARIGVQMISLLLLIEAMSIHAWPLIPQLDLRMREVANEIVLRGKGDLQAVLVDASPAGEGAFIAEALVASQGKDLYIVRSSKIMAKSDFMGNSYKLAVESPEVIERMLREMGIGYIVVSRYPDANLFEHNKKLLAYLEGSQTAYKRVRTLPYRHRLGNTTIFKSSVPQQVNLKKIRDMVFSKKTQIL